MSIKRQEPKNLEIIVVDNNSTDKTGKTAEALGCRVYKETKQGLSHARNRGAKEAKGNILCFVDADGILYKKWLWLADKNFIEKKLDAVTGTETYYHKNPLKVVWYGLFTVIAYSFSIILKTLTGKLYLTGNCLVIKKEAFDKLGGFEPVVAESFYLSKKFWAQKDMKGVYIPRMTIKYSSRGFDKKGYLKTIFYWAISTLKRKAQDKYNYLKNP